MKQLSIEEKAKRYDEIIEKANKMHCENCEACQMCIEELIPELKESEGEMIRKWLIGVLSTYEHDKNLRDVALAWLEKQGDYNRLVEEIKERKKLLSKEKEKATSTNDKLSLGGRIAILGELLAFTGNKQGEQKPDDKPKFKVGDILVSEEEDRKHIYKVDAITNYDTYLLLDLEDGYTRNESVYTSDLAMYLWTIQDAKDGDVLTYNDSKNTVWVCIFKEYANERVYDYCTLDKESFWEHGNWNYLASFIYTPATKEQRDLLFQKMKEAGYEWDAEHKQLKKIVQKHAIEMKTPEESLGIDSDTYNKIVDECVYGEQKSSWSEEDEKMIRGLIVICDEWTTRHSFYPIENCEIEKLKNWLKSLRPQPKQELAKRDKDMIRFIGNAITCDDASKYLKEKGVDVIDAHVWLEGFRPQKQYCNDVPSREYILNVWELGNSWRELTRGVCSTEHGTQLEYIRNHWKEGGYYDKISVCPQKQFSIDGQELQKNLTSIFEAIDKAKEELRKGNNGAALEALCIQYPGIPIQSQWKPNEEQMEALKSSTYCQDKKMSKVLFGLYQDLKKLREE